MLHNSHRTLKLVVAKFSGKHDKKTFVKKERNIFSVGNSLHTNEMHDLLRLYLIPLINNNYDVCIKSWKKKYNTHDYDYSCVSVLIFILYSEHFRIRGQIRVLQRNPNSSSGKQ